MEERLHGGNQISAKFVIVDFERAIHNALLEIFPDTTLYGCVWHFKHSLTKRGVFQSGNPCPKFIAPVCCARDVNSCQTVGASNPRRRGAAKVLMLVRRLQ